MASPLPPTPDTAKLAVGWFVDGQQLENTFYVRDASGAIFTDPEGFLEDVRDAYIANVTPIMFADGVFNTISFEDVRTVPFGGLSFGVFPPQAGGRSATAPLPLNVTLSIKRNTGNLGRSGRGRWFWASMDPSILLDDNHVLSTYIDSIITALTEFQTAVEGLVPGLEMGIVSYRHNNALRTEGLFQRTSSWSTVDNVVDSQRRRLPGRGK